VLLSAAERRPTHCCQVSPCSNRWSGRPDGAVGRVTGEPKGADDVGLWFLGYTERTFAQVKQLGVIGHDVGDSLLAGVAAECDVLPLVVVEL
jgi:hypothetical protein